MRTGMLSWFRDDDGVLIASFGEARLLKTRGGRFALRGGSAADRAAAYEWISLFFHEAVPKVGTEALRTVGGR